MDGAVNNVADDFDKLTVERSARIPEICADGVVRYRFRHWWEEEEGVSE